MTGTRTDPRLQLQPVGTPPRILMFALCVLLPTLLLGFALFQESRKTASAEVLAASLPPTLLITFAGTLLGLLAVWFLLDRLMHRHRLRIGEHALQIKTSFYSESVTWSDLLLDSARVVDLHERTEFKPARKSNAYALPGFKSGRFRLKNGERAFVAIAGERRALWLPTRRGFGLLLQPQQPEALLKHLRELAAGHAHR